MTTLRPLITAACALVAAGCGSPASSAAPTASQTPPLSPSHDSPAGAMAGFLVAAGTGDATQVQGWLATATDSSDLQSVVSIYASFGLSGGIFWEVGSLTVASVSSVDTTHANVTLSGDIVWCLGKQRTDPMATCNAVSGVSGKPHTYAAISSTNAWKIDIDINVGTQLDHNPLAAPSSSTATPSTGSSGAAAPTAS